jgi:tetratricopeptide (TPR) repeat protein
MSAVKLGLTTRRAISTVDQSEAGISVLQVAEKFCRGIPRGLKPIVSRALIVGVKAPTHKIAYRTDHKSAYSADHETADKAAHKTIWRVIRKTSGASRVFCGLLIMLLLAVAMAPRADGQAAQKPAIVEAPTPSDETAAAGNEVCAKCHRGISDTYAGTAMARASGPAMQGFLAGELQHAASGVQYRVYEEDGDAWLSFDRSAAPELHGKRKLLYFIGSGHRGRTFLFADDGFVFESPINFYAQKGIDAKGVWDMAPAFENTREMPLNLPAASSCLACHTSGSQAPIAGTDNKYGTPLFAHAGITCERCHGAGAGHVNQMGATHMNTSGGAKPAGAAAAATGAAIVNPAKLSPGRRDAVCMQCHLEGNAAIEQSGRHLLQFQSGDDLSDFVHYFVLTGGGKDKMRAVSQFEALAESKCKRASGDAMTCTSCHDPHSSPSPAEKVAFYRGKCLTCHGVPFAAKHHVEQPDCAQCHMARLATKDVAHTQATDHRILRVPLMPLQGVGSAYDPSHGPPPEPKLTRFPAPTGPADESVRDLALAWVAMGGGNSSVAFTEATRLLEQAVVQSPEDPAILSALGYNEQRRKLVDKAREHYEHALRIDPLAGEAAADLAVIEANAGNLQRAIALWKPAFERAPARSTLGLNLARGLCVSGHGDQAHAVVVRVLEFNPDSAAARGMLRQLDSGEAKCVAH